MVLAKQQDALSLSHLQQEEVRANPYPFYEQLREQDPIHWDDELGFWTLTRYDDIAALYTDERFSRAEGLLRNFERLPDLQQQVALPVYHSFSKTVFYSDPPYHTHLRGLMNHAFTPRYVERLRPYIRQTVDQLLDSQHNEMDVIHDLAYPLPVMVIAELIGLPVSDRANFKKWSDDLFAILGTVKNKPQQLLERAAQSLSEMTEYIKYLADQRRENMGDDLLSILLSVSDGDSCPYPHHAATPLSQGQLTRESPTASALTEEELVANVNILLSTGHETTTHLIGNGILALLKHPDQLQLLKERPALLAAAVDEILRYDNPVQITYRSALEDAELNGKLIRKGDLVNTVIGSANRDPERFVEPHRFDITRDEGRHLSFGLGIHYCIGAPLVKLEAEIAFETLLRRFPDLALATEKLEWQEHPIFRGLKSLPVILSS
ncbi:MAG: cytochrome P450 [Chloroflexota bacterium]